MTHYFFDSRPGRVAVKFRHHSHDFLGMTLDVRGHVVTRWTTDHDNEPCEHVAFGGWRRSLSMQLSSTEDAFPGLIAWLEAMTTGVSCCEVRWSAEGPHGRLSLEGAWPRHTDARLVAEWSDRHERCIEVLVDRRQLAGAFYQAFRRFVRSPRYEPVRYEQELRYGELLARENPEGLTEEEIVGHAVMLDRLAAETWLCAIRPGPLDPRFVIEVVSDEEADARLERLLLELKAAAEDDGSSTMRRPRKLEYGYTHPLWDRMSVARRRQDLRRSFDAFHNGWWGANLRELRSELVERWLGWVAPEDVRRRLGPLPGAHSVARDAVGSHHGSASVPSRT